MFLECQGWPATPPEKQWTAAGSSFRGPGSPGCLSNLTDFFSIGFSPFHILLPTLKKIPRTQAALVLPWVSCKTGTRGFHPCRMAQRDRMVKESCLFPHHRHRGTVRVRSAPCSALTSGRFLWRLSREQAAAGNVLSPLEAENPTFPCCLTASLLGINMSS